MRLNRERHWHRNIPATQGIRRTTHKSILVFLSSYRWKKKKMNNKENLDAGYFQITVWGCFRNNESRPAAVEKVLSGYWLRNITRSKCQFSARVVVSVYVLRQPRVLRLVRNSFRRTHVCVGAIDTVTKVHLFCSFAQPLEPSRGVFFIRKKALTKWDLWCCYEATAVVDKDGHGYRIGSILLRKDGG